MSTLYRTLAVQGVHKSHWMDRCESGQEAHLGGLEEFMRTSYQLSSGLISSPQPYSDACRTCVALGPWV